MKYNLFYLRSNSRPRLLGTHLIHGKARQSAVLVAALMRWPPLPCSAVLRKTEICGEWIAHLMNEKQVTTLRAFSAWPRSHTEATLLAKYARFRCGPVLKSTCAGS